MQRTTPVIDARHYDAAFLPGPEGVRIGAVLHRAASVSNRMEKKRFIRAPAMTIVRGIVLVLAIACFATLAPAGAEPATHEMSLVYIFESDTPEYVFVIGQAGFKTVAALKGYLATLPRGSGLKWAPGCKRMGGEPLLSSEREMEDFRAFLKEHGIELELVPSG